MQTLETLCNQLFDRCKEATGTALEENRLVQPENPKRGRELKTFPKTARDLFLIGWKLEQGKILRAFLLSDDRFHGYTYSVQKFERTQAHTHDYIELGYVLSGEFCQTIEGKPSVFRAGDFCLIDTNSEHYDHLSGDATVLFFGVSNRFFDVAFGGAKKPVPGVAEDLNDFLHHALLAQKENNQYLQFRPNLQVRDVQERTQDLLYYLVLELLERREGTEYLKLGLVIRMFDLLATEYEFTLSREQASQRQSMAGDEILEYIETNFRDIHIEDLQDRFHYNADYFNRLVMKRKNMTYSEYLQNIRLDYSAKALLETNATIDDIVWDVGYKNRGYFYKLFKTRYGLTPAEYRAKYKH